MVTPLFSSLVLFFRIVTGKIEVSQTTVIYGRTHTHTSIHLYIHTYTQLLALSVKSSHRQCGRGFDRPVAPRI